MKHRLKSASRVVVAIAVTPVVMTCGFFRPQITVGSPCCASSSSATPFGHTAPYRGWPRLLGLPRSRLLGLPKGVGSAGYRSPCGCVMSSEKTGVPLSGATFSQFEDSTGNSSDGARSRSNHDSHQEQATPPHDSFKPDGWDERPGSEGSKDEKDDEGSSAPSAGAAGEIGTGSQEFVNLVRAQFDVLAATLDVSQIVLFVRRENTKTGVRSCCLPLQSRREALYRRVVAVATVASPVCKQRNLETCDGPIDCNIDSSIRCSWIW